MRVTATASLVAVSVVPLCAHDGPHMPTTLSGWDAVAIATLAFSGACYAVGSSRLYRRGVTTNRYEHLAFWVGWLVMLAAILPPLDRLATQRFAAHMLQHELLMLIGVPLMIAGRPLSTWLWGLPSGLRRRASTGVQDRYARRAIAVLTAPVVAWALHGIVVWVWHVPALYERAVLDEGLHALQHAMFCGTSALFWWGLVYGRYGRLGYGASVFYVFTTVVHTGLLGAVFTLTRGPLYPLYARRAPDPLADQQIAGLVMWVPAGLILTVVGVALFAAWMGEANRRPDVLHSQPKREVAPASGE
jgi:putative membrane protein